jgi:hypothetical protein
MADYVDITPRGVDRKGKGASGLQKTVFQDTELQQIRDNPSGLTKEGILKKIELWGASSNAHVKIKYNTMLNRCTNIKESGKTKDGAVILARDLHGNPTWVDELPVRDQPQLKKK